MRRKYVQTVFDLFDHCKEHNTHLLPLRHHRKHSGSYRNKFDAVDFLFRFDMNNCVFLASKLLIKAPDTVTPRLRKEIDRLIVKTDDDYHYLDVYQLLGLNGEECSPESLEQFRGFFNLYRDLVAEFKVDSFQLCYEPSPMRIEYNLRKHSDGDEIEITEYNKLFDDYLLSNPIVGRWLNAIALDLKRVGRWSWCFIPTECVVTMSERIELEKRAGIKA